MNRQVSTLFNIFISFSGESAGKVELSSPPSHYRRLMHTALARNLYTREGLERLGRQLADIVRHAYFAREIETIEQASQLMLALPLSEELHSLARYYRAFQAWKQGEAGAAHQIFSYATNVASRQYQAQGLLTAGAVHFGQGEFEAALPYYVAAARAAREHDPLVFAASQKMAAVVQGIYGDHRQALTNLERLFPVIRALAKHHPGVYYEFLNSYAIELGEVGRLTEAQKVCSVVLASPYVAANPQFLETRDELAAERTAATPSVIAVPATAPEIIPSSQTQAEPARARSTIALKFRRSFSLTRVLATAPRSAVAPLMSPHPLLEQFAYSILPRGPPALS